MTSPADGEDDEATLNGTAMSSARGDAATAAKARGLFACRSVRLLVPCACLLVVPEVRLSVLVTFCWFKVLV